MEYISDELWATILKWGPYEEGFRECLNYYIDIYKIKIQDISNVKNESEKELESINAMLLSIYNKIPALGGIAYDCLVRDCDREHIVRNAGMDPEYFKIPLNTYFAADILKKHLPMMISMSENGLEVYKEKFRKISSKLRRKSVRSFLRMLDKIYEFYSSEPMKRGKHNPISWVHPVLTLIDSNITLSVSENELKICIKERRDYLSQRGGKRPNFYELQKNHFLIKFRNFPVDGHGY